MLGLRLTGSLDGAGTRQPLPEAQMWYVSEHPTASMVLARSRMQEDLARAEARRAARKGLDVRAARRGLRSPSSTGGRRGAWLLTALRAAVGRTRAA